MLLSSLTARLGGLLVVNGAGAVRARGASAPALAARVVLPEDPSRHMCGASMLPFMAEQITGESIREWRLSQNLTQEELAARIGVDQATLAKWERGKIRIPRSWLQFWALLFVGGFTVGVLEGIAELLGDANRPAAKKRGPRRP